MKRGILCCLLSLLWTSICSSANASLISADGWAVGDGLLVQDTSTGLTWLSLSATNYKSYNDIFVNNYSNLIGLGFFAPTISQVETLFYDGGAPDGPLTDPVPYSASEFASAQAFISLFGCTSPVGCQIGSTPSYFTEGWMISETNGARFAFAEVRDGLGGFGMSDADQLNFSIPSHASFFQWGTGFYLATYTSDIVGLFPGEAPPPPVFGVGIVPVPAALPLFATGLGALGLLGWRRKRKAAAVGA